MAESMRLSQACLRLVATRAGRLEARLAQGGEVLDHAGRPVQHASRRDALRVVRDERPRGVAARVVGRVVAVFCRGAAEEPPPRGIDTPLGLTGVMVWGGVVGRQPASAASLFFLRAAGGNFGLWMLILHVLRQITCVHRSEFTAPRWARARSKQFLSWRRSLASICAVAAAAARRAASTP